MSTPGTKGTIEVFGCAIGVAHDRGQVYIEADVISPYGGQPVRVTFYADDTPEARALSVRLYAQKSEIEVRPTAESDNRCPYCGHPKNSTTCQRSHP